MAASMNAESLRLEIRKLRKKLRQVEKLEQLDRDLSDDEVYKVLQKDDIRGKLQEIIGLFEEISTDSNVTDDFITDQDSTPIHFMQASENVIQEEPYDPKIEEDSINPELTRAVTENDERDLGDTYESREPQNKVMVQELPEKDAQSEIEPIEVGSGDSNLGKRKLATEKRSSTPQKANRISPAAKSIDPPKKPKREQILTPAQKLQKHWASTYFRIRYLEGHNDIVMAVDADGNFCMSGGRDTAVKVWDTEICAEQFSMGGHTGTIMAVRILSKAESKRLEEVYGRPEGTRFGVSGSIDCSIKLWSITEGFEIKSIYVFNPVLSLDFLESKSCLVIGASGGKIELWDLASDENILSTRAHEDSVSCLHVVGNHIYSGCIDGTIKIHEFKDEKLNLIFESENLQARGGQILSSSPIHCISCWNNYLYFGDEGTSLKAVNWKQGSVNKLANHNCEFGVTDAVKGQDDVIISSGYDIDNGQAYLNVRHREDNDYLATLNDEDTGRIFCISCTKNRFNQLRWVTGGIELKVWEQIPSNSVLSDDTIISPSFNCKFTSSPENSDVESDTEENFSDGEIRPIRNFRRKSPQKEEEKSSWTSWCTIV